MKAENPFAKNFTRLAKERISDFDKNRFSGFDFSNTKE
jgi:hypothetical protein